MNSNDVISKDDVSLFMEDFWPRYQQQRFPIGQAFFNFLQTDMHYSWAITHRNALMLNCSDAEHMKYIMDNAV